MALTPRRRPPAADGSGPPRPLEGLVNEVGIVTPVALPRANREPAIEGDPFSAHPNLLPGWNAYSGSGDVPAEVVYAKRYRLVPGRPRSTGFDSSAGIR
jgi:hypothetical protein